MKQRALCSWLVCALAIAPVMLRAQDRSSERAGVELRLRLVSSLPGHHRPAPAVVWLTALPGTASLPFVPHGQYTLLQKNRTFIPHLQVIPVGSAVAFPNADPFFHNVFSLFEGKRFDLGLYEAGSSKSVTFPREGASYIFCNIHPEMSAVILALSTPLYAIGDSGDSFALLNIPPGNYRLHLWIEGVPKSVLEGLSRNIDIAAHDVDLGTFSAPISGPGNMTHVNKFGDPYDAPPQSSY